jgi:hypothetical protein
MTGEKARVRPKFGLQRKARLTFWDVEKLLMTPSPQKTNRGREFVSSTILQLAITEAVRTFDPSCELFMGVFVERARAKSSSGANWAIKGIKFGKADRDKCVQAVATIVERMQLEFDLSGDR